MRFVATLTALAFFAALNGGCIRVNHETRIEKGPVLRAYERETPLGDGGVTAKVNVAWPSLTLSFARFDRCRQERIEEVVEERTTESFAPSAGPSFAIGVTTTAAGGALLGFRNAFSDQPNTRTIDESGRYGPSPRTVSTGWAGVLLAVGVPALVTGVVGLLQSGETVERRKVEQVASALELPCHEAPVDGEVQLVRAMGQGPDTVNVPTRNGQVTFTAQQLSELRLASVQMNGALVLLPEEESAKLEAFLSCNEVLPVPPPAGLAVFGDEELVDRYNVARSCAQVAGKTGEDAATAYAAEIQRRRAGEPGPAVREGPRLRSLDDAAAMYPPKLNLDEGSGDLARLSDPESLAGTPVRIHAVLLEQVEDNILVVKAGSQELLLFVPPDAPFAVRSVGEGGAIDAIGVVVGKQALEGVVRPLIRAVWIQ